MRITKQQRIEIIKKAIEDIKNYRALYLCNILSKYLFPILGYYPSCNQIQEEIPRFKQSIAIKYFHGKNSYSWWNDSDPEVERKNRLKFLNYLLTGKLPVKKKRGKT